MFDTIKGIAIIMIERFEVSIKIFFVLPAQVFGSKHVPPRPHLTCWLITDTPVFVNRTLGPSLIHPTKPAPTRNSGDVPRDKSNTLNASLTSWEDIVTLSPFTDESPFKLLVSGVPEILMVILSFWGEI